MTPDPASGASSTPPVWLRQVLYAGRQVGTVAHLVTVGMPAGAVPGPGVGWHTLCGKWWASGIHTGPDAYGFGRQGDLPLCRPCERKHASADSRQGVTA